MLKLLFKAFKILAVIVLTGILIFGIYLLVQHQKWPWWVGVAIFVGFLGIVLGSIFLKKYLFRRREEKFVKRIVDMDETVIQKAPIGERRQLMDLQSRWTDAVEVLRRSHLKKHGNPLYVLPWFIVMGESGGGKTTAIKSAGLLTPLTDVSPATGLTGTRNCDWWFFEKAIILDTAGRYSIPVDEGPDKEEWEKFLRLLAKYRRREPINGAMIVIPADKLMNSNRETLTQDARSLRRRVDELMRVLGAKFPVYVIVTKTDKVLGLSEYGEYIPEGALSQAMGMGAPARGVNPSEFVRSTMEAVTSRLKDLRLLLLHRSRSADPGLLLFPDELNKLQASLELFVDTAFEENPYQETPLLRGIYFTSGRQTGSAYSQLIGSMEAFKDHKEELPGTEKGLFLRDLFTSILPGDRDLFAPIKEYLSWRRVTQSLGLTAWAAVILCLCGALTLSFVKNMDTIDGFVRDFQKPPELTEDLSRDLLIMGHFRSELLEMEELNRDWWFPRLGLNESHMAELKLKKHYCQMFREGFLDRLDKAILTKISGFSAKTRGEVIGAFVEHLETRINLLVAELKGVSVKELENMPQPSYAAMVVVDKELIPAIAAEFTTLYLSYLEWSADKGTLNRELSYLRQWQKYVAGVRGTNLHWLVNWANVQPDLWNVTMNQFWGNYRPEGAAAVEVKPAYTKDGRERIENFLTRYESSLEDPSVIEDMRHEFEKWYWREYVNAWLKFGKNFAEGYIHLENEDDMRVLAQIMADPKNPYFELLDRMAAELEPVYDMEGVPVWVRVVVSFQKVKKQARQDRILKSAGFVAKAAEQGKEVIQKAVDVTGDKKDLERMENIVKAAEQLKNYEKALAEIIPVTSSRQKAFSMASQLYQTGAAQDTEEKSPFRDAYSAFVGLRGTIRQHGQRDNVFWRLYSGPLYFLMAYTTQEASCELQTIWEGTVLADINDMPEEKLRDALFKEQEGLVWKFVNGPAKPFLTRDLRGYFPRSSMDQPFPFENPFLAFLNQGSSITSQILPEYSVKIKAKPTDVNRNATLEPFGTMLILDCRSGSQQMENYNFPAELEFKWEPDKCADVTLKILFNDFTLTKVYSGVNGFPDFLSDFKGGVRTFTPEDFPDYKQELENISVNEIRVGYIIEGSENVKKLHKTGPLQVPLNVVRCWQS